MTLKEFTVKARDVLTRFLATPLGHAVEHAVTAALVTALGLLASKYFAGKPLTLADVRDATTLFVSTAAFGIRTAVREALKAPTNPTKRSRRDVQDKIVSAEHAARVEG